MPQPPLAPSLQTIQVVDRVRKSRRVQSWVLEAEIGRNDPELLRLVLLEPAGPILSDIPQVSGELRVVVEVAPVYVDVGVTGLLAADLAALEQQGVVVVLT